MFRCLRIVCLSVFAHAARLDEGMWGPDDSVRALDAVIVAVEKVANNTHLSPDKLKKAKHVAEDIKSDIEAVEGGNLTKQQAHERVGAAMKELMAFEEDLAKTPPHVGADRVAALKKELAEKKAELAKDQNMIKLLNLKKQLAEKKLMLQKLLLRKAESEKGRMADSADAEKTGALVKKLLAMVRNASAAPKSANKTLHSALGMVRERETEVSASLTRMEARHNKSEASLDAFAPPPPATGEKHRGVDKAMAMLKHLRGQERHLYKKARAAKQAELKELKEVDAKVEHGDLSGLQQVLTKLENEGQAAKNPGSFLH